MPAAQNIIALMIIKLHRTKRYKWTWAELFEAVLALVDEIVKDARLYYPTAISFNAVEKRLGGANSCNVQTALSALRLLAIAWPSYEKRPTISMRQFMFGKTYPKTLVLGRSTDFDPKRRVWLILDEIGRLPKLSRLDEPRKAKASAQPKEDQEGPPPWTEVPEWAQGEPAGYER
ncbi:hypothetical protein GCM10011390_49730 [Aureimonas endophytica]|uniref:Uncharacterized protein n=1 Tax=Aureimonas endophytica TaxID=2027858 RepID=A0A917A4A8_9HYPH|nr:hypothetical protein [Aureimonas endophytica]GGE24367.1 hypothetical protein GCM10011390_49730 [Aureimonas endophytica]